MGVAQLTTSEGRALLLAHSNLLGTYGDCVVRLRHRDVSRRHAQLWYDEGWYLRDLGSTNGTSVDGQALAAGEALQLQVGQTLCFGSPNGQGGDQFVVNSVEPPVPLLIVEGPHEHETRELTRGEHGLGPAGANALLRLRPGQAGEVEAELLDGQGNPRLRNLRDGDAFAWASVPYRLSLPGSRLPTRVLPTLAHCSLRVWTPRPGGPPEAVCVDFLDARGEILERFSCKDRKMKLLWVLVRQRLDDRAAGKDAGDEGRVTRPELVELMGLPPKAAKPNLAFIQRGLRDLIRSTGSVQDPEHIVELGEALDGTLLYRVGVSELEATPQAREALRPWSTDKAR